MYTYVQKITPDKMAKLPLYVREALEAADRQIRMLMSALDTANTKADRPDARVRWGWYGPDEARGTLPDGETLHFYLGENPRVKVRVKINRAQDGLSVNGDGTMLVELGAANDCTVKFQKR